MTEKDIERYKHMLEEEQTLLVEELRGVAVQNPAVEGDWVPAMDKTTTERHNDDNARREANTAINESIATELEARLSNVNRALKKIEDGTFGVCEVTGQQIEPERLDANPAARTCIAHKDDDLSTIQ